MLILDLVLLVAGAFAGFASARALRVRGRHGRELSGLRSLSSPRSVPRAAPPPPPTAQPTTPASPPTRAAAPALDGAVWLERSTPPGSPLRLADQPFTIGRRPDRDLVLADDRVSREHASLLPRAGRWVLRDDGSSNGTRVNGHRVAARAEVPLRDGDQITVGGTTFVFHQAVAGIR